MEIKLNLRLILFLIIEIVNADECINGIKSIFSSSLNTLNIITSDKRIEINDIEITKPPFFNLNYKKIKVTDLNANIKKQIDKIIDMDYYKSFLFAIKKEFRQLSLISLDLEDGKLVQKTAIPGGELLNLKSFTVRGDRCYVQLNEKIQIKQFKLQFTDGFLNMEYLDSEDKEFLFEFNKIAFLNFTDKSTDLHFIFEHKSNLYFHNGTTLDKTLNSFHYNKINANRLTNCLLTLCDVTEIDGFLYLANFSDYHYAIVTNNNNFFALQTINLNGLIPVRHFNNYGLFKRAFTCELLFTFNQANYCTVNDEFF